jgi:integrase
MVLASELESVAEFLTGSATGVNLLPWQSLRASDVRVVREWLAETQTPAAQRRALRALRGELRRPVDPNALPASEEAYIEPGAADPLETPPVRMACPARRTQAGAGLSTREARLLVDVCRLDARLAGRRDAAVLALMLLGGLRRQEIVGLTTGDLGNEGSRLRVRSRGRPPRFVLLEGECLAALEAWLAVRSGPAGPLFPAFDSEGRPSFRGLSPAGVNRIVALRAREAGLGRITPRELRHRFLSQLRAGQRTQGAMRRCAYDVTEDGEPAWTLGCLPVL